MQEVIVPLDVYINPFFLLWTTLTSRKQSIGFTNFYLALGTHVLDTNT